MSSLCLVGEGARLGLSRAAALLVSGCTSSSYIPSRDGRWFVSVGDGDTSYIPVVDPDARIVVPLGGFVSWC